MTRTLKSLIAAAALLGPAFAHTAFAAEPTFPRLVGSGESAEIDYGPGPRGNIFGGGRVIVSGNGENVDLRHLEPHFAQAAQPGLVPVTVGEGDNTSTAWVPAGTDRARLAVTGIATRG